MQKELETCKIARLVHPSTPRSPPVGHPLPAPKEQSGPASFGDQQDIDVLYLQVKISLPESPPISYVPARLCVYMSPVTWPCSVLLSPAASYDRALVHWELTGTKSVWLHRGLPPTGSHGMRLPGPLGGAWGVGCGSHAPSAGTPSYSPAHSSHWPRAYVEDKNQIKGSFKMPFKKATDSEVYQIIHALGLPSPWHPVLG